MKTEYKVIFDDYSETKVSANTALEAKMLAQAKRIEAGKPFGVHSVERLSDYGVFESIGAAHLETVRD